MADDIDIETSEEMEEMAEAKRTKDDISFEIQEAFNKWAFLRNTFLTTVSNDDLSKKLVSRMMAGALTEVYANIAARELNIEIPIDEEEQPKQS